MARTHRKVNVSSLSKECNGHPPAGPEQKSGAFRLPSPAFQFGCSGPPRPWAGITIITSVPAWGLVSRSRKNRGRHLGNGPGTVFRTVPYATTLFRTCSVLVRYVFRTCSVRVPKCSCSVRSVLLRAPCPRFVPYVSWLRRGIEAPNGELKSGENSARKNASNAGLLKSNIRRKVIQFESKQLMSQHLFCLLSFCGT